MREPGTLRSVFISSTSVDLHVYRDAVKRAIERMDQHPVVMGNFGAQGSGDATSVSRENVARSDIYVLIVAWRYGSVPAGQEFSVTEQEYQEARANNLPCFVYLADLATDGPNHDDSPKFPAAVRDPDHRAQLDAFRALLLKSHVLDATFSAPDELATKVVADLGKYLLNELRAAQARERGVPHDLPPRAEGFVGRERELAELCDDLRRGESVGLSAAVAGMAGVGKSALAAEVAHALAADEPERFPGGMTWLRCDNLTGLGGLVALYDQLLLAWDAALPPEVAARDMTPEQAALLREQALRARLRPPAGKAGPDAGLALLDNVEPGLPLSRALATLNALGVRALITSRAEPSVAGLHIKRLDVLDPEVAAALFRERYTATAEGSWDAARDDAAAGEVVDALGYLPLAIELAAARAGRNRMSVAALAAELHAPNVLAKLRNPLDPTASVRYAFEQTIGTAKHPGALTPTQWVRFVALGLPAGPDWPRGVIEAYLDNVRLKDIEAPPGADDLEVLIALSLVTLVTPTIGADAGEPARLRLHPLLRQYAAELRQAQDEDNRKAELGSLVAALSPFVEQHKRDFTLLAYEENLIVEAINQAADCGMALGMVDIIIDKLLSYISLGGHWALGVLLRSRQLHIMHKIGDRPGEGTTLNNLGRLANNLGHKEEAAHYYELALAIRREVGDRSGEGVTLNNLGALTRSLGRIEEATRYYQQALAIRREVGDRPGEGTTLNNLGRLANNLGHKEEAAHYYELALAIRREVGDRSGEGVTLNNLGALTRSLGRIEEATRYYQQALLIAREVSDRRGEGVTLNNLGLLAKNLGRIEEAALYFEQALGIAREVGDRRGEGTRLNNLGALARSQGYTEEAALHFEQALGIAREVGDRRGEGTRLNNLGGLADESGRKEEAIHYYEQALAIFREIGAEDREQLVRETIDVLRVSETAKSAPPAFEEPPEWPLASSDEPSPAAIPASKKLRWRLFGRRGDK